MIRDKYTPIVLSGPSGSGKTELIEYIEQRNPEFQEAIGYTTRKKRESANEKINTITQEEFELLIKDDKLIEYCNYNGNYYGMPKSEFNKLSYCNLIFNVSYSSAREIKSIFENTPMIYMLPPTKEELLSRLGERDYNRYLLGIEETMKYAMYYEYLLISYRNDLPQIYDEFMEIAESKDSAMQRRLVLSKNKDFVNKFYK